MQDPLPALEARLRELSAQMADRDDLSALAGGDPLEYMDAVQRRELRSDLIRMADRESVEVQAAIQRVKDGTYGACEECGDPISAARRVAKPYAVLCRDCQEEVEMFGRGDSLAA